MLHAESDEIKDTPLLSAISPTNAVLSIQPAKLGLLGDLTVNHLGQYWVATQSVHSVHLSDVPNAHFG